MLLDLDLCLPGMLSITGITLYIPYVDSSPHKDPIYMVDFAGIWIQQIHCSVRSTPALPVVNYP